LLANAILDFDVAVGRLELGDVRIPGGKLLSSRDGAPAGAGISSNHTAGINFMRALVSRLGVAHLRS
jgi:hypothetical protein